MSSPFFQPDEIPTGVPTQQALGQENAFRDLQNALRRQVLPSTVEAEIPDLAPLSPAVVPEQEQPSLGRLVLGGILRQRLGVDIFAGQRSAAAAEAERAYREQVNVGQGVSLDAIASQIEDPAEREAFQRRVGALSPLERRILEASNPGFYATLPAETLKLIAPGSVDPTNEKLQTLSYLRRMQDEAYRVGNPEQAQAIGLMMQRVEDSIGVETTTLSPGSVLVDSQTGAPIARGAPTATSADNFVTPTGVDSAIPGTDKYFDFVARGYPKAPQQIQQTTTTVDKVVERNLQEEAAKVRFGRERLLRVRNLATTLQDQVRIGARIYAATASWKDAAGIASEAELKALRESVALSSDVKNEFALLVQNLTGAAYTEDQRKDFQKILDNWDTFSPTQLVAQVETALSRNEDFLLRRYAYDQLRQGDATLSGVNPWEMSTERTAAWARGAVAAAIRDQVGRGSTEQVARQRAINAIAFTSGVTSSTIERLLREPTVNP